MHDDSRLSRCYSQLTGETSSRASGTFSYGYDGGTSTGPGNPTSFKGHASTFNADNQVTGTGYAYNGNGSPTTYKGQALAFDPEQRLTGYNGSTQTDGYDGDGLRAWKQAASVKTYFLYDGSEPVCEYNGSGTLTATSTFGADGLVSRRTSATAFYLFDERGSVAQRTTSTGSVASSDLYDAFGTRSSTGGADPFGYGAQAGYYTDSETGLVLCTHRYFDPSTGRWLTRDPMGYGGGVNLYGYVGNDPANEDDPDGTQLGPIIEDGAPILSQEAQAAAAAAAAALAGVLKYIRDHPLPPIYGNPPWSNPLPPIVATPPAPIAPTNVRGGKILQPNPAATGDHSTWRTGPSGRKDTWQTWRKNENPRDPKDWTAGDRFDRTGRSHADKYGNPIKTPHVVMPGDCRPAEPGDIPK